MFLERSHILWIPLNKRLSCHCVFRGGDGIAVALSVPETAAQWLVGEVLLVLQVREGVFLDIARSRYAVVQTSRFETRGDGARR